MAARKTKLTIEQHEQIGAELKKVRNQLMNIQMLILKSMNVNDRVATKSAVALNKVDELRSVLDGLLFKQHPNIDPHEGNALYYDA